MSKKEKPPESGPLPLPDRNTASGRVKRYARVGGTVAGLAARVAGERYLGLKIDRDPHAAELLTALGGLKGPLMKVGQILATIPEALPPEYAQALQNLQSNAPPMGKSFVRRRMRTELGPDWETRFQTFDFNAAAAASLGQVHRATTLDGRAIACKLQYPDMRAAIAADLNQLKIAFTLFEKYDKTFSTRHIHAELEERLYEELDYTLEARRTKLYAAMLRDCDDIQVPEVIDDLSTPRLLSSTWLEGRRMMDFTGANVETRNRLAKTLFRAWYVPLYGYGIIHGDPHPGNYSVDSNLHLNLLDFGCVRVFPARFVGGVIDLYHALMTDDIARSVHAYETWGFKNLNKNQIETLNIWARFLYGPVMEDKIRPIGVVTNGVYGRETAQKVHKKLKEAGGVTVPREFVFMDRAALGLGSIFLHLRAEVNWYRLFNDLIADFNLEALEKRQREILHRFENIGSGG